jgi:hypothetical protein
VPGTAHVPFCVAGAGIACFVRRHLALSGVMLAGQARLAAGSMQACHEAINDGEGLVQQWRVAQLRRLGIPGPPAQAEADHVGGHQIAGMVQRSVLRGWCGGWPSMSSVSPDALGRSWCMAAVSTSASGAWAMSAGVVR